MVDHSRIGHIVIPVHIGNWFPQILPGIPVPKNWSHGVFLVDDGFFPLLMCDPNFGFHSQFQNVLVALTASVLTAKETAAPVYVDSAMEKTANVDRKTASARQVHVLALPPRRRAHA